MRNKEKGKIVQLDFKCFLVALDVAREHLENIDCRKLFADAVYKNGDGIAANALALKIYQSSGMTEYTDEEIYLMKLCANNYCKAFFADALNRAINSQIKNPTDKQR